MSRERIEQILANEGPTPGSVPELLGLPEVAKVYRDAWDVFAAVNAEHGENADDLDDDELRAFIAGVESACVVMREREREIEAIAAVQRVRALLALWRTDDYIEWVVEELDDALDGTGGGSE